MNEVKRTVEQGFYQDCAALLGATHQYKPFPYERRTRWNNRGAGNGRMRGFGLIRLHGESVHMQLRAPERVNRWFSTRDAALSFLAGLRANRATSP
jgi:hypothetical protein